MTISIPSYVIPGTYFENLCFIADDPAFRSVRSVELLFFEWDDQAEALLAEEAAGIRSMRDRFSFSLHMPPQLMQSHETLIAMTRRFVDAYVVHPPAPGEKGRRQENADETRRDVVEFAELMAGWIELYGPVFDVENTVDGESFSELLDLVPELAVCCDTGHLLLQGRSPTDFLTLWAQRVRRVHLHGVCNGKDHCRFQADTPWFQSTVPMITEIDPVLHLELFNAEHVLEQLDRIAPVLGLEGTD